jgi:hypothetical protein
MAQCQRSCSGAPAVYAGDLPSATSRDIGGPPGRSWFTGVTSARVSRLVLGEAAVHQNAASADTHSRTIQRLGASHAVRRTSHSSDARSSFRSRHHKTHPLPGSAHRNGCHQTHGGTRAHRAAPVHYSQSVCTLSTRASHRKRAMTASGVKALHSRYESLFQGRVPCEGVQIPPRTHFCPTFSVFVAAVIGTCT